MFITINNFILLTEEYSISRYQINYIPTVPPYSTKIIDYVYKFFKKFFDFLFHSLLLYQI